MGRFTLVAENLVRHRSGSYYLRAWIDGKPIREKLPAAKANDRFTDYTVPTVEEDGNAPFRYPVESSTPGQWYLVDLTDRGGFGACSCVHSKPWPTRTGSVTASGSPTAQNGKA